MLISVFALLEGSVSSLLIAVERKKKKIYANAHAFDTKKMKKRIIVVNNSLL